MKRLPSKSFVFSVVELSLPTLLMVGFYFGFFQNQALTSAFGGWDGVSHVAMAEDYARHTWPDIFGWTPAWYLGMPFPNFYPPLLFWIVGGLNRILGVPVVEALRWLLLSIACCVPVLFTWIGRSFCGGRIAGWVAGLLSVFLMTRADLLSANGLTLLATFEIGLFSQLLGLALFLVWLVFLVRLPSFRFGRAGFSVLTAAVLLTNVHLVPLLGLTALMFSVVQFWLAQSQVWRNVIWDVARTTLWFALGVLLAAVWWLPMAATWDYVATKPLVAPHLLYVPVSRGQFMLLFGVSFFASLHFRNLLASAAGLTAFALMALMIFSDLPWFASLPIQPARILVAAPFLAIPAIALFISSLAALFPQRALRLLIASALPAMLFIHFWDHDLLSIPIAHPPADYDHRIEPLLSRASQGERGRFTVETVLPTFDSRISPGSGWHLNARLGARGGRGLYSVYREASISSYFSDPLRNAFSAQPDLFGIDSSLAMNGDFLRQSLDQHEQRADLFNLRYFLVHSEEMRTRLSGSSHFVRREDAMGWTLFERPAAPDLFAHIPKYRPFLVVSALETKARPLDVGQLDFFSLSEKLFEKNDAEIVLVRSPDKSIADILASPERLAGRYSGVLILAKDARKEINAHDLLVHSGESLPVWIQDTDDPLSQRLRRESPKGVVLFRASAPPFTSERIREIGLVISGIRDTLPQWSLPMLRALVETKETASLRSVRTGMILKTLMTSSRAWRNPDAAQERLAQYLQWREEDVRATEELFSSLAIHRRRVLTNGYVSKTKIERNQMTVELSEVPDREVPVILHQSYFPRWALGEERSLLASPSLQVVYAQSRVSEVQFRRAAPEWIGMAISFLTFLGIGAWFSWVLKCT